MKTLTSKDKPMLVKAGNLQYLLDGTLNLNGWYVQPKLNGIRCHIVGRTLYSRDMKPFKRSVIPHVYEELEWKYGDESFPSFDGELYIPDTSLQDISSICNPIRDCTHPFHKKLKFFIFDLKIPRRFADRLKTLETYDVETLCTEVVGKEYKNPAEAYVQLVVKDKFEGAIFRHPNGYYQPNKRSPYVLKFKPRQRAHFQILGWQKGEGKYNNLLGALILRTPEGRVFRCGTGFTDEQRRFYTKLQVEVTALDHLAVVDYEELSKDGIPLKPSFVETILKPLPAQD